MASSLDKWVQDIMSQKFLDSDLTRLILIDALCSKNCFQKKYPKQEIKEYIYRVYSDNENAANVNPSRIIKNIHYYGIEDIEPIYNKALSEWLEYAPNKVLTFDNYSIYMDIDKEYLVSAISITRSIISLFKQKYFVVDYADPVELNPDDYRNDTSCEEFGLSIYRNRVLEDMQYCQICEETKLDLLRCVHIVPSIYCSKEELIDKNNGLIMCVNHFHNYVNGDFYFKENGFVKKIKKCDFDERSHISIKVKNSKRRYYLAKYQNIIEKHINNDASDETDYK